jgi:hypothetical protein
VSDTLFRPGIDTSINLTAVPEPSGVGVPMPVPVRVDTASGAANGKVRTDASMGASCIDDTPTPITDGVGYSCALSLVSFGSRTLRAEFLGTGRHHYSVSAPILITIEAPLFASGVDCTACRHRVG